MSLRQRDIPKSSSTANQYGAWVGGATPTPVQGTIVDVNPQNALCTVRTDYGQLLFASLPGFNHDPDGGGGTLEVPRRGQDVIVEFGLGRPYIVRYLATATDVDIPDEGTYAVTETALLGESFASSDATNFIGRLPKDTLPGDFIRIGNQGQAIGILDEGVALLRASPWSQIRTIATPADEVVQVFGRNTELHSGFGTLEFGDRAGKSWVKLVGGTDQLTETGLSNWTARAQIGGDIGGLALFQLSDKNGDVVYGNDIGHDGTVTFRQRGNLSSRIGGSSLYDHSGERTTMIRTGDDVLQVLNGGRSEDIRGNRAVEVSGNTRVFTGRDHSITAQRDIKIFAGRNMELNAAGDVAATPGSVAAQWNITNGDLVLDIGNPARLDPGTAQSGLAATVWSGGNIVFWPMRPPSKFIVTSGGPDSIALGAAPITHVAPFHAMFFEMFQILMTSLSGWLDTHVHPAYGGPTGTPLGPWSSLSPDAMVTACKSNFVTLGG